MKFAILFCLVAFACVAHAQEAVDSPRASWVESAKEKLQEAKKKVDELIEKASNALQDAITEAKQKAQELTDRLTERARQISEKVYENLKGILDRLEGEVEEASRQAKLEGVDVSECKQMTDSVRQAILAIVSNSSACINEKIEQANEIVQDVGERAETALTEVKQIREEANECVEHIEGLQSIVSATACVTKSGVKATWVITKQIPGVTLDFAKMTALITTIYPSLSYCMSKNAIVTVAQEARVVIGNVRQCIAEKIEEAKESATEDSVVPHEPEVPQVPEVPQEPEVPQVPEVPQEPQVPQEPEVPQVPQEPETQPELPSGENENHHKSQE